MTVNEDLKKAEKFLNSQKYEEATALLNPVLKAVPNSHKALLLMTQCLMRQKMNDLARETSEDLLENAIKCGRHVEMYEAFKVSAMFHFRVKEFDDAFKWIVIALKYNNQGDNEGPIFKEMVIRKLIQKGEIEKDIKAKQRDILDNWKPVPASSSSTKTTPVTSVTKTIEQPTPQPVAVPIIPKIQLLRHDWYDSSETITISIYVKKIDAASVITKIDSQSFSITFKDNNGFEYSWEMSPLSHEIVPEKCNFKVFGTKIECTLEKGNSKIHWKSLVEEAEAETEQIANAAPTASFGKNIDWSAVEGAEEEEEDVQDPDSFFKKLYSGADADTQRAMMKSYSESNGTSLSMNWNDVGAKHWDKVED